jgi:23S rRNA (uracil1939-C5)-methyltransferase
MALVKNGICKVISLNEDSFGLTEDKKIKLSYVLPGEEVEFELHEYRGRTNTIVKNILAPSSQRQDAACKYFGTCGGCLLQHMKEEYYIDFKMSVLKNLIDKKWHEYIKDPIIIGPGSRRKAIFEVVKKDGQIFLGFHRFHSHQIINIDSCPALLPEISDMIPEIKEKLQKILPEKSKSRLFVIKTTDGVKFYTNTKDHAHILIDNIKVEIAPDSFLQASEKADVILQDLVKSGVENEHLTIIDKDKMFTQALSGIDLFCGRGTFTLPLSRMYKMTGLDIEASAIDALNIASQATKLNIKAFTRDLFAEPVLASQLKNFDFAVINPPRAGAELQITELAKSAIQKIIYVSCNPKTFASDFRILEKFGYYITSITPVDQFHWSTHLEIVVVLSKNLYLVSGDSEVIAG